MRDGIGTYTMRLATAVRDSSNDIRVVIPRLMPGMPVEVMGAVPSSHERASKLNRIIAAWGPDIVHVQFAIAAFGTRTPALMRWLVRLRRDLQIPVAITLHEMTRESALLHTVGNVLFRWIATHSDKIIVHTKIAFNALVREVGVLESKVTIIPHPVAQLPAPTSCPDELRSRFGLANARILLAFGFIHADKGLDDLIRALIILRDSKIASIDNVRLVVAGSVRPRHGLFRVFEIRDNLYLARVLRRAKRNCVREFVILTGYVPDGEIAPWFKLAEAVVLPYRRVEQSGVAGMARSLDLPVLSSSVGGLSEYFGESTLTFPPRAPKRIAATLASFLGGTLNGKADVSVETYYDDSMLVTDATLRLYSELVSKKVNEGR